jgi:hypothetical protein
MVNPKRRTMRQSGITPAHAEYGVFKAVESQFIKEQKRLDIQHSGNRHGQKARCIVAKLGLRIRVGRCYYSVPQELANKVIGTLTKRSWWDAPHHNGRIISSSIRYIVRIGENLIRKKSPRPIAISPKCWKLMKEGAGLAKPAPCSLPQEQENV